MALSLVKQTVNNAQGNVTPNALLYGYFVYNQIGDLVIQSPIFAVDGQIISIRVNHGPVGGGGAHSIGWSSSFKGSLSTGYMDNAFCCHVFFCDDGDFYELSGFSGSL